MIKHMAADGTLPDDFRNALTPMYAQGLEAEGILANSGWTERFEAMGANKEIALAMAATLPVLISGTKGAKGPKNTTTCHSIDSSASEIKPQAGKSSTGTTGFDSKLPSNPTSQAASGVARPDAGGPVRFIAGVTVKDVRTGQVFTGTVDLKPTFDRIQNGGSNPHKNDGTVFQNRPYRVTGLVGLPVQPLGYCKEYVHPTPGITGVGPQRIVVGQRGEAYYTNDHYKTFIKVR